MHRILSSCLEAAFAAFFLVPIFLYLNKYKFHSKRTTSVAFLFAFYLCIVYSIVGLPNIMYVRFDPNFNFIPFLYFFSDRSTILNVFLFIPLGLFLPVLRSKFRFFLPTVLFGLVMSATIEMLQIFTLRATDINDLLTNTLGTALGYIVSRFLLKLFPQFILSEETNELKTIFISVLLVMFFLQPHLAHFMWNMFYM